MGSFILILSAKCVGWNCKSGKSRTRENERNSPSREKWTSGKSTRWEKTRQWKKEGNLQKGCIESHYLHYNFTGSDQAHQMGLFRWMKTKYTSTVGTTLSNLNNDNAIFRCRASSKGRDWVPLRTVTRIRFHNPDRNSRGVGAVLGASWLFLT